MGFALPSEWQVFDRAGRRKYLNKEERRRWLAAADAQQPHVRALMYLLLFSGCRISEALNAAIEHVDVDEKAIWLRTLKRRRLTYRRIPLPAQVIEMLTALPCGKDG